MQTAFSQTVLFTAEMAIAEVTASSVSVQQRRRPFYGEPSGSDNTHCLPCVYKYKYYNLVDVGTVTLFRLCHQSEHLWKHYIIRHFRIRRLVQFHTCDHSPDQATVGRAADWDIADKGLDLSCGGLWPYVTWSVKLVGQVHKTAKILPAEGRMLQDAFTNTDYLDGPTRFYLRPGKSSIFFSNATVRFYKLQR